MGCVRCTGHRVCSSESGMVSSSARMGWAVMPGFPAAVAAFFVVAAVCFLLAALALRFWAARCRVLLSCQYGKPKALPMTETISNAINRKAYLYFRLINIYTRFFFFVILFVSEPS